VAPCALIAPLAPEPKLPGRAHQRPSYWASKNGFVAAFESDGIVRRAAPIIKALVGMTEDEARAHIAAQGWQASIVAGGPTRVFQRWESFEVHRDGKIKRFMFDTNAFRRGISGRVDKETARRQALAFADLTEDRIEVHSKESGPPPWSE
jgi:hypothetical protein